MADLASDTERRGVRGAQPADQPAKPAEGPARPVSESRTGPAVLDEASDAVPGPIGTKSGH